MTKTRLPDGKTLAIGAASSAYQVEGAAGVDGRGPSIWDSFVRRPGAVRDGSDGDVACDSYHRFEEDIDLVRDMGGDCYRFSISWPRVIPEGDGRIEPRGLDFYDRLVDAALDRGLLPVPTLYHWDLPQALEDRGGWFDRATAEAFGEYSLVVHGRLGDRLDLWATQNEPWCAAYLGYAAGIHAPGRREGGEAHRAAHHLNLAHGLAAQALHDAGVGNLGIAHNLAPFWPDGPDATEAAHQLDAIRNRIWLGPLVDGAYDEGVLEVAPVLRDPTLVRPGDLDLVRGSIEWLGVNYYTPFRPTSATLAGGAHLEIDAYPGVVPTDFAVMEPKTDIGWEIGPDGLTELLIDTYRRTGLPLMVTENGAAFNDECTDGAIADADRTVYIRDHIAATEAARDAGVDVRGYFVWTLLDNFEWAEGYTKPFGIVHVDPRDQARTPKASYEWLRRYCAARGGTSME